MSIEPDKRFSLFDLFCAIGLVGVPIALFEAQYRPRPAVLAILFVLLALLEVPAFVWARSLAIDFNVTRVPATFALHAMALLVTINLCVIILLIIIIVMTPILWETGSRPVWRYMAGAGAVSFVVLLATVYVEWRRKRSIMERVQEEIERCRANFKAEAASE